MKQQDIQKQEVEIEMLNELEDDDFMDTYLAINIDMKVRESTQF